MSRPPGLSYLTIYNPLLKPNKPVHPNDEDAEEQAQILFYTSRERAVSRDRMLRQVGLAKAMVNFSALFNSREPCNNVHSQSRRMVFLSPEPGFFIHACLDLASTARPSPPGSKLKGKGKDDNKSQQTSIKATPEVAWNYHEWSIHDDALRRHLEMGYEQFKLTHGTFTSILSNLGQEALELQLERFFTVWAWSWDVEEGFEFGTQLGLSLHPYHYSLQPLLDSACFQLDDEDIPFLITPPHIVPSARYNDARIPPSLAHKLISTFPPRATPSRRSSSKNSTIKAKRSTGTPSPVATPSEPTDKDTTSTTTNQTPNAFLSMPHMNLNMEVMDVRKWNWGALTFGRGRATPKSPVATTAQSAVMEKPSDPSVAGVPPSAPPSKAPMSRVPSSSDAVVDMAALADAIASEGMSSNTGVLSDVLGNAMLAIIGRTDHVDSQNKDSQHEQTSVPDNGAGAGDISLTVSTPTENPDVSLEPTGQVNDLQNGPENPPHIEASTSKIGSPPSSESSQEVSTNVVDDTPQIELPPVYGTTFHIGDSINPLQTTRRRAYYLTKDYLTFVLLRKDAEEWDQPRKEMLAAMVVPWIDKMLAVISVEDEKLTSQKSNASAADALTPTDRSAVLGANGQFLSSSKFSTRAEHLFNVQSLLRSDPHIYEVFSRDQKPQHWHIARRDDREGALEGEAYLEVLRKETSLSDVDNQLSWITRNWL